MTNNGAVSNMTVGLIGGTGWGAAIYRGNGTVVNNGSISGSAQRGIDLGSGGSRVPSPLPTRRTVSSRPYRGYFQIGERARKKLPGVKIHPLNAAISAGNTRRYGRRNLCQK